MSATSPGRLIVFSGPSGAGKTTVLREVLARCPWIHASVSATTRPPRPGETDGVDYHFLTPGEFARRRETGDFLESFEVFGRGHWYGTPQSEVAPRLGEGKSVLLEIDVEGMIAVTKHYPQAVTIFVRPESLEELERRLRARGTETEADIQSRLAAARYELQNSDRYQHVVINATVDTAVADICRILNQLEKNR